MTKKQKIFCLALIGVSYVYFIKVANDLDKAFCELLITETED